MTESTTEVAGPTGTDTEFVAIRFKATGAVGSAPAAAVPYYESLGYEVVTDDELAEGNTEAERLIAQGQEQAAAGFDPNEAGAKAVAEYLNGLDTATPEGQAEYDRVVDAERAGQNRSTAIPSS